MKNIFLRFLFAGLSFMVLTRCGEEVLEIENPNAITLDRFFRNTTQFNSALNTVYAALQFQSISGAGLQFEMLQGDEAATEFFYNRQIVHANLSFGDASEQVIGKWSQLYIGIYRANQVLFALETNPDVFDDIEERDQVEAQARFLRAFFYFQVAHDYNGAVLRTDPRLEADVSAPFLSIEEITNQIILPDLIFAKANLPEFWPDNQVGRATWGTATSMLGKVYLYQEDWAQAASEFREVIDSGIYSLAPDNLDNFSHLTENNSESILETAYSAELNPGAPGGQVDDTQFITGAEASALARDVGQLRFGGFNTLLPTYYMHELFIRDAVDSNNPINDGNLQSKRMGASIAPLNADGLYYLTAPSLQNGWGFGQTAYVKKHTNWYFLPNEDGNSRSGINFRHIRLADVFLMYAEAVLEANGDVDTAIDFIDRVRTRAGVITLRQYIDDTGEFPEFHKSITVRNNAETTVAPSIESVMTHLRRVERPLELFAEGHRWKDLVRWGIAGDVLNELAQDEAWRLEIERLENLDPPQSNELNLIAGGVGPLFIRGRVRPDFQQASVNYNPSNKDYFPLPANEVQTNDQLNN
ncbi:RagB/SusD family nutrient uptake outer membrane protein [Aquimarina sp. RZ0]|uniref:RagB/SusD family nutrient uptake outer membrane protein n=1 Tax=Aquimarina sp. RZ0 TaxID=2607730 RepID=UPI0011F3FCD5|nr:RagB/SusD family nutrient uptake outer membrane protein [Aquimarina sp. RZ0]KAA1243300.1 RagB/SusD family nutrient uptake outer membrane protein [Aquimarina sp. RZ0]